MTNEELEALVNAEVESKIAAVKAAEPVVPTETTFTQAQVDVQVKDAATKAAQSATAKWEAAYKAQQRPPFVVPPVIPSEKSRKTPMPFYWAIKTALYLGPGKEGIRFHLDPFEEGDLEFDGTQEARDAFKAMATTIGSAVGEHFIPRIQTNLVTQALYAKTFLRQLPGVNIYPMPGLVCDAPEIAAFTAGWGAENAIATAAGDPTTARKTLIAKNITALAKLSNQVMVDSNPQIEQYVRDGISKAIAVTHDTGGLFGTNANDQPKGVTTYAGITSTAIGSDDFYTAVAKAVGRMAKNNLDVSMQTVSVVTNPGVVVTALTTRTGTSGDFISAGATVVTDPALLKDGFGGRVAQRLGYAVFPTSIVPVASNTASLYVIYGPNVVIGDRQELEIAASNVAGDAFAYNQTFIRAIQRVDFILQRTAAIEIITGAAS